MFTTTTLTETQLSPKLVFKTCQTCHGTGKAWVGSGTGADFWGAERDCFGCQGNGRLIDLDATMRGVMKEGDDHD